MRPHREKVEIFAEVLGSVARGKKLFRELFTVVAQEWLDYQMERVKAERITLGRHSTLKTQVNRHIIPYVLEKVGAKAKIGGLDWPAPLKRRPSWSKT